MWNNFNKMSSGNTIVTDYALSSVSSDRNSWICHCEALRSPAERGIFVVKKIASSPEAPRNDSIDLFLVEAGRPLS
jgi:hypothetical protein